MIGGTGSRAVKFGIGKSFIIIICWDVPGVGLAIVQLQGTIRLVNILKSGEEIAAKNEDQKYVIEEKSKELKETFERLNNLTSKKTRDYEEAAEVRRFLAACKALDFWLIETRTKLEQAWIAPD